MKCSKCEHRGALVFNPQNIEGRLIRLCLPHLIDAMREFQKQHYH